MMQRNMDLYENRKSCLLLYVANVVLLLFAAVHLVSTRDTWELVRLEVPAAVVQEAALPESPFRIGDMEL